MALAADHGGTNAAVSPAAVSREGAGPVELAPSRCVAGARAWLESSWRSIVGANIQFFLPSWSLLQPSTASGAIQSFERGVYGSAVATLENRSSAGSGSRSGQLVRRQAASGAIQSFER